MKRLIRAYIIIIICLLAGSATASVSPQHFTKDEILFISSYNSDTKYTYSSISQFVDEYIKLGGKYSPVVESMNCTTLENQAEWIDNMDLILEKRYGATLNTPRITTVYQENTDAKSQVDMLQFMKGFNVKLCYYYEYGVKEDIEFIRNLFPQTENIAIISDNSYAGLSQMKYVENEIA